MRVFTSEDGALEDVFAGENEFGDLYWDYSAKCDVESSQIHAHATLTVFMPSYDFERDAEWKFGVDRSRWQMIGLNRGTAYSVKIDSGMDAKIGMRVLLPLQ